MVESTIKKIWFICLWFASLALAGCFHIPDEDWLPSKNKVETWDIEKNKEVEEAFDLFMDWIDMISSGRNEIKNSESEELDTEVPDEELVVSPEYENVSDEGAIDEENEKLIENTVLE